MLPSKMQRDRVTEERINRERDYEARKAAEAENDKRKHKAQREEFIVKAVNEVSRDVLQAVQYRKTFIFVRCSDKDGKNWTADATFVADEITARLISLGGSDYTFERVIEDATYYESSTTADGGPGEDYRHPRFFPAVKISWE